MTKSISSYKIAEELVREQIRSMRLIRRLAKAVVTFLAVAALLTFILSFARSMPFFYSVTEDTVIVSPGDTLWQIAEENIGDYPYGIRSYLAEIRRLNDMGGSSDIVSGSSLRLPVYRYVLS